MLLLSWLIQCLLILLSVAFFTLFERKVMGLFHNRLGPNKVSFLGLLQPLIDAFKLLSKQYFTPLRSNKLAYNLSPQFSLVLALLIWIFLPLGYSCTTSNYSFMAFFIVGSSMVFGVLLAGWSSNSKYSLIGSLRSVAQSISYESVFSTVLILVMVMMLSFSITSTFTMSSVLFLLIFPLWFICTIAETHRAPFDFSESESELVSGFNTEYSGAYFAFIFLSEYSVMLFSCFLISYIFVSWMMPPFFLFMVMSSLGFSFVFVWIRVTFCRFRYDMLMMFSWKVLLPFSLMLFIIFLLLFMV